MIAHNSLPLPPKVVLQEAAENVTYLFWAPKTKFSKKGHLMKKAKKFLEQTESKLSIYMTKTEGPKYFNDIWRLEKNRSREATKTWLTTGFFTLVTALNMCEHITAYGFMTRGDCSMKKNKNYKVDRLIVFSWPTYIVLSIYQH